MRRVIPLVTTLVVIGAMIWQATTSEAELMPAPEIVFPDFEGARFDELPMSEAEVRTLPKDTLLRRRLYRFGDGSWIQLSAVVGGHSKSSVHRPELCLPGQGFLVTEPRTVSVNGVSWRLLTLEKGHEGKSGFAYTFVNGTGFRTSSHLVRIFTDVWDRSILGRIDRWVMLTVSTSVADERALRAVLGKLKEVVK